tara:strand:+ start:1546 stop:4569 length:3024 start_codon:yes stop_codon:yes gene_type:complete
MPTQQNQKVSIIVPAYNASTTLERTIASVKAQDYKNWEIILIDDGSTDDTPQLAQAFVKKDKRISYFKQNNAGVSAARNTGLTKAGGDWILFLDSDDTIDPRFLSKMMGSANDNRSDIVICEYLHCNEGEKVNISGKSSKLPEDAITELMIWPYFAVHAAITKREHVLKTEGFDTTLRTCEDWDFWIKILTQEGIRYSNVNEVLAYYHNTPDSLSKGASDMFADCREIRRRQKEHIYGALAAEHEMDEVQSILKDTQEFCWYVAVDAAQGHDKTYINDTFEQLASPFQGDVWLSECVFEGLNIGSCLKTRDTFKIWPTAQKTIEKLFTIIEERTAHKGAADMLMHDLYDTFSKKCEIKEPLYYKNKAYIRAIPFMLNPSLPDDIDCVSLYLRIGEKTIRLQELPIFQPLTRLRLLRVIAYELCDKLLGATKAKFPIGFSAKVFRKFVKLRRKIRAKLFKRTGPENRALKAYGSPALKKIIRDIKDKVPKELESSKSGQEEEEYLDYFSDDVWEKIFKTENPWNYDNPYEQLKYKQTLDLLPDQKLHSALELACAEGHFTIDLADHVDKLLATDISETAVKRAAERCKSKTNIEYGVLDFVKDPIEGQYDLIVCSEVLYYTKDKAKLYEVADKIANALNAGGYLLMAHAWLIEDDTSKTAFGWGDTQGVDTIIKTFLSHADLDSASVLSTELYQLHLIQKKSEAPAPKPKDVTTDFGTPLPGHVAADIVWGGAHATRYQTQASERTRHLPIPMYHRIAEDAPEALRRYTVKPDEFEKQLRYMHRRGFYSIDPTLLNPAQYFPWDIEGRPTVITFDDAYVDFLETAWPILQRNGFGAHMFVPTGYVGGKADWDNEYGDAAPIMNWDQIKYLSKQGVTFGSHLVSHRPSTELSLEELLEEAIVSKTILEQKLGKLITSVAPPYGVFGRREERIFQIAGYGSIFGINDGGWAENGHTVLSRVFPDGTQDLNGFSENFPASLPAPDDYDLNNENFKTLFKNGPDCRANDKTD